MATLPRLMLVTDRRRLGDDRLVETVAKASAAGPVVVQVREKDLSDEALAALVRHILERSGDRSIVMVNGRPQVAAVTGAGLHLPAAQTAPVGLRPAYSHLGCAVHTPQEVELALALAPDYLVAGTVFSTDSKPGQAGCGVQGLQRLVQAARGIPVFAIGGMEPGKVPAVLGTGAHGVAVCGAVLGSADPERAARRFHELLD